MIHITHMILALVAIATIGCGDPSTDSEPTPGQRPASVSFSILWKTPPPEDPGLAPDVASKSQLDGCPVAKVQCKVYGDGKELSSHTWNCSDHQGSMNDIPPGPNRQFIVFGLDGNDRIIYRGQADRDYDLRPGETINIGRIEPALFVPNLQGPADGTITNFVDLTLTWDAVQGASAYHVTVSENSDFSDPITEYNAPDANCKPSELTITKTYYWRVSAVDAYQNGSMASASRSFNVTGHRLPDTGQTDSSFEETFGEDADYNIYPPSYKKLDATGTELQDTATEWVMVKDEVTSLIWEVKTDDSGINDKDNTYIWDSLPQEFIAQLNNENYGGRSDWRLPTIKELTTLINYGNFGPAINTIYFPRTRGGNYWTLSESADAGSSNAWAVNFQTGYVSATGDVRNKSNLYHVRAVCGEQIGYDINNMLVVNGDTGTVTDQRTGLMWQQVAGNEIRTWVDALGYCETLELAGHKDWRLPNVKELQSIVDFNKIAPAIEQIYFPDTNAAAYWSSTRFAHRDATPADFLVWTISFSAGATYSENRQIGCLVRAVRGGQ